MGSLPRVRRRRQLGVAGERAAADLLKRRGYDVVGAGFAARRGENATADRSGAAGGARRTRMARRTRKSPRASKSRK